MDRISVWLVRTSLVYLVGGFGLGAVLLATMGLGQPWSLPRVGVVHAHLLFVGWLVQFVLGIAFWLLPRRRVAGVLQPTSERWAFLAYGLLNTGLVLRAVGEPSHALYGPTPWGMVLVLSAALQAVAAVIVALQLWVRVLGRPHHRRYRLQPPASGPRQARRGEDPRRHRHSTPAGLD
ncbi:MAG: hypothetical protein CL878_00355 [Dehalococcoidia bacterium]|nr:hypothetical protein [Dehalococcoidia bacterium]